MFLNLWNVEKVFVKICGKFDGCWTIITKFIAITNKVVHRYQFSIFVDATLTKNIYFGI